MQTHRCKIAVHELLNILPHFIIIIHITHGLTADYILTINSDDGNMGARVCASTKALDESKRPETFKCN